MANDQPVTTETYQGPSKLGSAFGGLMIATIPSAILAKLAGINGFALAEGKKGIGIAAVVAGSAMEIYGAVRGWNKAGAAQDQFTLLKQQNEELAKAKEIVTIEAAMQAQGLQNQIAGLQTEVASGKKSFVEMHTKHTAEKEELEKQFAEKAKHHASQLEAAHAAHAHHASHVAQHEAPQAEAAQPSHTEAQAEHAAEHAAQTSHADAHTSRAEHGGHAAAHEAEKQAASHAEVAR